MSRAQAWLYLCHSWLTTDKGKSSACRRGSQGLIPDSASYLCEYQPLISQLESHSFTAKVGYCYLFKMMGLIKTQRI